MPERLCVLLPEIGVTSETFLRWDIQRLLPGGVVVVGDPPPNGETVTGHPAWDAEGAPALVLTPTAGDPPPSAEQRNAVLRFLAEHRVEVVLIEYFDFADRWFDLLLSAGIRVWVRGHGIDLSARLNDPYWRAAYQRFSAADGLIVPSQAALRRLVAVGLPADRIHVVRCCVEVPADPIALRAEDGTGIVRCVAIGRLVEKKAPLLVLEAFANACGSDHCLTLDIVGDGPLMQDARRYVERCGLAGRVTLHGRLPHGETLQTIRGADLLLHHAITADDGDAEGLPVAVLEGMAAGLAVVATAHEGIPEVIKHGANGLLVAERDVASMSRAIRDLSGDPTRRRRLGAEARATVRSAYTEGHVRRRLLSLLQLTAPATTTPSRGAW